MSSYSAKPYLTSPSSFLAGSLPLSFALSSKQLRFITAIGTGVLVGTSLVVIIPEGVETLYSAHGNNHAHKARAVAFTARSLNGLTLDLPGLEYSGKLTPRDLGIPPAVKIAIREAQDEDDDAQEGNMTGPDDGRPVDAVTPSDEDATPPKSTDEVLGREGVGHDREPHVWVGISLILGFILMYLIDRVPHLASASAQPRRFYVSLDRLTLRRSSQTDEDADDNFPPPDGAHKPRSSSTTVGLVIHAAADGIALGASSTTSSTRLGFIIFLALMIHKAPAAFGLTSVLLKQGLSKRQARTRLIVFSLAAPAGALAAWTAANIFGGGSFGGEEGTKFATGVLLLFSGGTFL